MKYLTGFDRRQATLFPTCIDDLIPEDAEVRVIDLFVDALPLKDLGFGKSAGGRRPTRCITRRICSNCMSTDT